MTTVKLDKLQSLIKALKVNPPKAKIGILGGSVHSSMIYGKGGKSNGKEKYRGGFNDFSEQQKTNAEIGAIHEFGTSSVPQRSFLKMPISDNLSKEMQKGGLFDKDVLEKVVGEKSLKAWVTLAAVAAVACVADAFNTGGNGKWAPLSPKTMDHKKVHQTLVETQQLRNSITYEVTDG